MHSFAFMISTTQPKREDNMQFAAILECNDNAAPNKGKVYGLKHPTSYQFSKIDRQKRDAASCDYWFMNVRILHCIASRPYIFVGCYDRFSLKIPNVPVNMNTKILKKDLLTPPTHKMGMCSTSQSFKARDNNNVSCKSLSTNLHGFLAADYIYPRPYQNDTTTLQEFSTNLKRVGLLQKY